MLHVCTQVCVHHAVRLEGVQDGVRSAASGTT